MSIRSLEYSKQLLSEGQRIGRVGMSQAVIDALAQFDGSYKGAMILAGRLKAVAQMASCDTYWAEQVLKGFQQELHTVHPVPEGKEG